jgi:PAS domain S-box-containing protein
MAKSEETMAGQGESGGHLRLIADNAPVIIIQCDRELRYKFINKYHAEQLKTIGVEPTHVIGKRVPEILGSKFFAIIEPYVHECLLHGRTVEFEVEASSRTGEPHLMQFRFAPEWKDDKIAGFIAVGTDVSSLKRAEAALRESNRRLQLALEATQLGAWQYNPVTGLISIDRRAQEIFGIAVNEAAVDEIIALVHRDDTDRVWAVFHATLDPADSKRSSVQFRLRTGGRKVRWVEVSGRAWFDGAGHERRAASMVGTAQDITERKEREKREHILMREVNHRAKNMLSIVDAIARQTATRRPEDFVERFSERIQALSANQDLLIRNDWQWVDIQDLARAQLAPFADLIGPRIVFHGTNLPLKPASTQAIGLAVHELATNAGKYGALSTDRGRVDVSWGIDGNTFMMEWSEREGPPVSAPPRGGFGVIVAKNMVEQTLNGAVDLDYATAGLIWRLTCPAANALERGDVSQKNGAN